MVRSTTIKVSETEKDLLDETARAWFGTEDVAYGHIIERLCREKLAIIEIDNEYEYTTNLNDRISNLKEKDAVDERHHGRGVGKEREKS